VAVDASAAGWPTVYVSAGRRGLQVSLAPDDLVRVANATVAPIATA
jgi:Cys-tRNA(Pro)/Cys-tRNA(Cys) deacylase